MDTGTVSPARCSICMEYRSSAIARIVPCYHEFDLACVSILLQSSGIISRHCPLCRARIEEIHYNFKPDGTHQKHIAGPTRPESPLASGPFIRENEELRPEMSPIERDRVLELRRLHQGEDYKLRVCLVLVRTYAKEGDLFICISDCIDLEIDQVPYHAGTSSSIKRKLTILTLPTDPKSKVYIQRFGLPDPYALAQARLKIEKLLKQIGTINQDFTKFQHTGLKYKLSYDGKGLAATVRKSIKITKSEFGEEDIQIVSTTHLSEIYQTKPPGPDPEFVNGISRKKREMEVRLAREEVQGAVEFVFVKVPGFRVMERGMTGVLDVRRGGKCSICEGGRHRSGDCELNLVVEVVVEDGEVGASVRRRGENERLGFWMS